MDEVIGWRAYAWVCSRDWDWNRIAREWVIAMVLGLIISAFCSRNVFGADSAPKPETVTVSKAEVERMKLLLKKIDEYTKTLESENYELRGRVESFKGRGCS